MTVTSPFPAEVAAQMYTMYVVLSNSPFNLYQVGREPDTVASTWRLMAGGAADHHSYTQITQGKTKMCRHLKQLITCNVTVGPKRGCTGAGTEGTASPYVFIWN